MDYADQFTLDTDAVATPEEWARAMLGDVPSAAQWFIWRGLLGLRLSRGRSPDTVAGWRISGRGADRIRLEASSWLLTGHLVVRVREGQVALQTLLRYERAVARAWWRPLSVVHRALIPGILRAGEVRLARRPAAPSRA